MPFSLAIRFILSPQAPGIKSIVPTASSTREIASISYLPLPATAATKSKTLNAEETDDEDEEYM